MEYRAGDTSTVYRYVTDAFGKITGLIAPDGNFAARYVYDGYGNCETRMAWSDMPDSTAAALNPFRYNGYYYDAETGLYYCNSRYYDAENCRFINVDASLYHSLLGYNLFLYCYNDPINYYDPTGEAIEGVLGALGFVAAIEPTPIGEVLFGITVVIAVTVGGIEVGTLIGERLSTEWQNGAFSEGTSQTDDQENDLPQEGEVDPNVPPREEDGYKPPRTGPRKRKTKDGRKGWEDKNGNIWVPAETKSNHGGAHWDVQRGDGKGYANVYPGGRIRLSKNHGKIPIF